MRFLRVGDITGKSDRPIFTDTDDLVYVTADDVVLTVDGSPGAVSIGNVGAISSGLRRVDIVEPDRVSSDWVRYALMTSEVQATFSRYAKGLTILHASGALPHIRIPVGRLRYRSVTGTRTIDIVRGSAPQTGATHS